jgi:hypothetical protein
VLLALMALMALMALSLAASMAPVRQESREHGIALGGRFAGFSLSR